MNLLLGFLTAVSLTLSIQERNASGGQWLAGCSAVLISKDTALTAAHCFEEGKFTGLAWAKDSAGRSYKAELVARNTVRDLAIVRLHGADLPHARLARTVKVGQSVYTVNSGAGLRGTYSEGVVSNIFIDQMLNNTAMILHTASIRQGASGSGLFDWRGRLVGINTITLGALSEAVDTLTIRHFLERDHQLSTLPISR